MKNNFKFLIVLAILLAGCICIGSTFAADSNIDVNNVGVDNTQNIEIAHDDSNQNGINNLKAKSVDDNSDKDTPDKLVAEKSDVTVTVSTNATEMAQGFIKVTVTLNETVSSGNVTLFVDGNATKTMNITNNNTVVFTRMLYVGKHNITAVFNGNDEYNNASGNVVKVNVKAPSNINVNTDSATYGKNLTITAKVTGGYGNPTGNVTFNIIKNGSIIDTKTVDLNASGIAVATFSGLAAGSYSVNCTYNGDENYLNSARSYNFDITKAEINNVTINVSATNITSGETLKIWGEVSPKISGNVTLYINGTRNATQDLIDSKYEFNVTGLAHGNYSFYVIFNGNANYTGQMSGNVYVTVNKINLTITVSDDDLIYGKSIQVNGTFSKKVSGTVFLYDNETAIANRTINGPKITFSSIKLGAGIHSLKLVYIDNTDVNNNVNSTDVTVNVNKSSNINVTVTPSSTEVVLGQNISVTVKLGTSLTGTTVTLFVNGNAVKNQTINGSSVTFNNVSLPVGINNITAVYNGNDNYTNKSGNTVTVNVEKSNATIDITNVTGNSYGQNLTITAKVTAGATGTVTFIVSGKSNSGKVFTPVNKTVDIDENGYAVAIFNDILPATDGYSGNTNVTVIYNGDENFTTAKANKTFKIAKANITSISVYDNITNNNTGDIIIVEGQYFKVYGYVDPTKMGNVDVKGNAHIYIFQGSNPRTGWTNSTNIYKGNYTIYVNTTLVPGIYNLTIRFTDNNGNYTDLYSDYRLLIVKGIPSITVENITGTTYGETLTVTAKLNYTDATGNVTFVINGNVVVADVNASGYAVATFNNLPAGDYNVTATYNGDEVYSNASTKSEFSISPKEINITVTVDNITYGDNITGVVDNGGIPGNLTVQVVPGSSKPEVVHIDETGEFTLPHSLASKVWKDVAFSFLSDDGNYRGSAKVNITVNKATPYANIDIIPEEIIYGDDVTVIVTLPDDATGNVTIIANDQEVNVTVVNGSANATFKGLNADIIYHDNIVKVIYSGDDNYNMVENSTTLPISPKPIDISAIINNITYGDGTTTGVVNASMNGDVVITIYPGTRGISVDVNESGEFTIPLNLPAGMYNNVHVSFLSTDGNYMGRTMVNITINPADPQVTVDIGSEQSFEIKFGDTVVCIVGIPDDATGVIEYSLDNETWIPVTIPEGKNSVEFDIPDLDAGNYILFVKYSGDGNYNPVYSENHFSVDQLKTIVTVDPVKGKAGEKVKITARVTDERGNPVPEGTVIIGFNGKEYEANVVNGIATVEVVLPKAGTYSATSYYEGINYNSSYTTFTVEVSDIPGPNPDPNPNPVNPVGNMENTGNPLLVLLIALAAIGLESFRRKF